MQGKTSNSSAVSLAAVLDALPCAALVMDHADTIQQLNVPAERLFGYTRTELLGRPAATVLEPVDASSNASSSPAAGDADAPPGGSIHGRRKDGTRIAVRVHLSRLQVGAEPAVLATVVDVGEQQQQILETVRKHEDRFRLLVDGIQDYAITMLDPEGVVVSWNSAAERMSGYAIHEVVGRPISSLFSAEDQRRGIPERNLRIAASEGRFETEGWRRRRDGTRFWVNVVINPLRDPSGTLYGFGTLTRDVTSRRLLEERLQATFESAPIAIAMIDAAGRIVLVNAQAEVLFRYSRTELLGQPLEILVPMRSRGVHAEHRAAFGTVSGAYRMGAGRDLYGLRKDGTEFAVEIGLSQVSTEQEQMVVATIMDVTERRRQEAQLRNANEALERSNQELQRFAYVASHDLQTPMRSIASFVDLLGRNYADRLDPQATDWMRRVVESVRRLQTLISDLLEYSRVDAQPSPFVPVAMREVFEEAVSLLAGPIADARAEVTCGALPEVMGDHTQLVQVLLNLIDNALKYRSSSAPRIHVAASYRHPHWMTSVRDNGIGIEPRHQQRIFEIFKRLHDAREIAGSGIGLAICRRVIERHGGEIRVQSAAGDGSEFLFTLPGAPR